MSNEIPAWVKVGALVIEQPRGFNNTYAAPMKIEKVHKNGRFIIENDSRQWTPTDDSAINRSSGGFSYARVYPFDGERKNRAEQSWKISKYKRLLHGEIERLEKIVRSQDFDAIEKEALKFEAEVKP